jgi:hypothetical protein
METTPEAITFDEEPTTQEQLNAALKVIDILKSKPRRVVTLRFLGIPILTVEVQRD